MEAQAHRICLCMALKLYFKACNFLLRRFEPLGMHNKSNRVRPSPGNNESAGVKKSGKIRKGNKFSHNEEVRRDTEVQESCCLGK